MSSSVIDLPTSLETLAGWGRTAPGLAHVLRPTSSEQVQAAVAAVADHNAGRPSHLKRGIVARGLGRSYGDVAQNTGGLVVDMNGLATIHSIDPDTAVVLFDVVLGYGSAVDPIAGLLPVLTAARDTHVVFIGYVCGTDLDPQNRDQVVARLESAGVLVASSNAEAATWSATLIAQRAGVTA